MKTNFALASVIAAVSGLAALANTAKAGTDLHVNLNFGRPAPVVVVPTRGYEVPAYVYGGRGPDPREARIVCPPEPRGYWKEITVKTWVPARWIVNCDFRGREVRVLEPAHFAYRTDRVWVDAGRDCDRDDRHDGRGHDYNRGYRG